MTKTASHLPITDPAELARNNRYGLNHISFSEDGRVIATSNVQMGVQVREGDRVCFSRSFQSQNLKTQATDRVRGLHLDASGQVLYIAAGDTVYAVDVATGEDVWTFTAPRSFGFLIISPICLAYDASGIIGASFDDGSIAVWNSDGLMLGRWHDNDAPRHLFFAQEGERLIGTSSFALAMWDITSRRKIWRLPHSERAFGMAYRSSGHFAVRTLRDISVWEVSAPAPVFAIPALPGLPLVKFHPTEPLVAVSADQVVDVLDFSGRSVRLIKGTDRRIVSMAFSPDGRHIAIGDADENLSIRAMVG